jgi:hypothetical protein
MNYEQKYTYIQRMFLNIDLYNFKKECIIHEFKDIHIKYLLTPNYDNFIENDILQITNDELIKLENYYDNIYNELKNIAKSKNINLFESEGIDFFIKYYDITFTDKEIEKSFIIEI